MWSAMVHIMLSQCKEMQQTTSLMFSLVLSVVPMSSFIGKSYEYEQS